MTMTMTNHYQTTVNNRQTQKNRWDRQLLNQKEKINKYQDEVQLKL
jgi:hypothetical protein